MTKEEKYSILLKRVDEIKLYKVSELQKALYALGYGVPYEDLYVALKSTGWVKLRLIRDRLLESKRRMPKGNPFGSLRQIVKWPLMVSRYDDLPEWENNTQSSPL